MTRGAWTCLQQEDGFKIWLEPRENEKPFTDSERAQRWRLSLASLLFVTILLSDHLWFCAEAKLTRTRDKFALTDMGVYPSANPIPSSNLHLAHSSLRENEYAIFVGNSTKPLWRLETCHRDSLSKNCFTFDDADHLCKDLSGKEGTRTVNISDLYLSFCNSYSLLDLFYGSTSPDNLNCSLDVIIDGDVARCSLCVQAYQRYDQHALEKYEEFELMTQKYETDAYSVRTCMDECKVAYKPWLCAQYFPTTQRHCGRTVPCLQYCLEVQQRCPFILPDNDDLIHGGSPSFICTGLLGSHGQPNSQAECCDVRWDSKPDNRSRGTLKRTPTPSCHHQQGVSTSVTSAATPTRLCSSSGRLKLCLLVFVLLHTVVTITTASHNSTGVVGVAAIFPLEESSSSEE
ncbi:transmembrane protein FAM155A [Oncorhynchus tshawytscha]|uniref:Transmembrane protein FAM155A n=1 Tax=Oncorhynchus tshawytscha TaxID=74940 RepID=A0A8C8GC56_ONCTS|nr:transmembrane protein FAM155A [Oncorhynchus tshawytscha]